MPLEKLDHVNVRTTQLDTMIDWYSERSYRLKAVASLTAEAGSISLRPIAVATLL